MQTATRQSYSHRAYYLLVLPATLILLLVNTFPLLYSCYISVTNYSLSDPDTSSFVGLNNFVIAFRDQMFLNSLLMTVKFTLRSVFCEFSLGLLITALLNPLNKSGNFFLSIFLLPLLITPTILVLL